SGQSARMNLRRRVKRRQLEGERAADAELEGLVIVERRRRSVAAVEVPRVAEIRIEIDAGCEVIGGGQHDAVEAFRAIGSEAVAEEIPVIAAVAVLQAEDPLIHRVRGTAASQPHIVVVATLIEIFEEAAEGEGTERDGT